MEDSDYIGSTLVGTEGTNNNMRWFFPSLVSIDFVLHGAMSG